MSKYTNQETLKAAGFQWAANSLESPRDYVYYGDYPLFDTWGIVMYLEHRDSDILQRANSQAIRKLLEESDLIEGEDYAIESSGHWAVGWIDQLHMKVINDKGEPHRPVLDFMQGIKDQLEDYPILDEDLFSELEEQDLILTIECYLQDMGIWNSTEEQRYTLYYQYELYEESLARDLTLDQVLAVFPELNPEV